MDNNDKKFSALIKLMLWLIFIIFLVIVAKFSNKEDKISEISNNNEITYIDKIKNLNDNYRYTFEINFNDTIYKFVGEKNDTKDNGYRLVNDEYLYYLIENDNVYEIVNGEYINIDNLYEDIDITYLDIANLKEILLNNSYSEFNGAFEYLIEDNKYIVYVSEDNIEKIEIYIDSNYYKLSFSDINKINY